MKKLSLPFALILLFSGCSEDEEIRVYTVPHEETAGIPMPAPKMDAILGVILQGPDKLWFFKITGPKLAVATQKQAVRDFMEQVHLEGGKIHWHAPSGWVEKKGNAMRVATLVIPSTPPLELAISNAGGSILSNVNRWRGQVGLPPVEDLAANTTPLKVAAGSAVLVHVERSERKQPEKPLTYAVPEGWKEAAPTGMRVANFEVKEGDEAAFVTVIPLAGGGGGVLANVNRWLGQIGLEPTTAEKLPDMSTEIQIDGTKGLLVDFKGTEGQRLLGAIVEKGSRVWFFKVVGTEALIEKHKERFEQFVASVKFHGG